MKKLTFLLLLLPKFLFCQLPIISFNGTNNWTTNNAVTFDSNQNQALISCDGSTSNATSLTVSLSNPPNVFYLIADFQLQNVTFDQATIKNPYIVVKNQAGAVIYRYTMKDNLNFTWFKSGIKIENYAESQITIEFGINKANGSMLVKNPILSNSPPLFSYEFPFQIPADTSTSLHIDLNQKHYFENDLLSSNTHFVFAKVPWSDTSLQNAITNHFPMTNSRFPGGTVGNYYNYQTDNFYVTTETPSNLLTYNQQGHTLDYNGYKNFLSASNSTSTYMLNIMLGTVQTAKSEFINRYNGGLQMKWIELGNEMYLSENQLFTNVIDKESYKAHSQLIANEIKSVNPTAKIAVCLEKDDFSIGEWNHYLSQFQNYYDATVLHNYIATDLYFYNRYASYGILSAYKKSMNRFNNYSQMFPNKPLLITEWGITGNVAEPYFIQTLGIADIFLAIEKANQMNIVKQAGIHMLYKNNQNDTATLMYFNNNQLFLTSKGKLYSKLFDVFKDSEVYDAETISAELELELKAVYAKMTKKNGNYKVFAVNKLPVNSLFSLKINGHNFNGNYTIETYSEAMSNPINGFSANSNVWNSTSSAGQISLPQSSISIITISESEVSSTLGSVLPSSKENIVTIHPNPSNDLIYISKSLNSSNIDKIEISSIDGRKITEFLTFTDSLSIGFLNSGVYIFTVHFSDGCKNVQKVVKS